MSAATTTITIIAEGMSRSSKMSMRSGSVVVEGAPGMYVENPLSMAPKRLFGGIVLGAIIATMGTFPLALIRALSGPGNPLFLIVERMIGTTVGLGVGMIFFFIGLFFDTIVTFVSGRRNMISEGVETCVYYAAEKKSS